MTGPSDPNVALDQRRMHELSVDECLELLGEAGLGRVAFAVDGEPTILPVNFILHEGAVLFRTTYGPMLDAIGGGARVAFEVDSFDAATHVGWSVVIHGRAEEIWLPDELEDARHLPINPWAPGDRNHYVRIFPSSMTGRRIQ